MGEQPLARRVRPVIELFRRHRSFRLLWFGETISQLGTSVTSVALPLVAVQLLHSSAFVVSLLSVAAWLPWLVVGLPVGAWVDGLGSRRWLLIACDVVSAVSFASIPLAATVHILTAVQLILVALVAGAASVIFSTAYQVFLRDLIPAYPDRVTANGALQGSASAARVAGPGVAGLLVELVGAPPTLLTDAISFVISATCLAVIRPSTSTARSSPMQAPLRRRILEGLAYLRTDPLLRTLTLFGGASNLALMSYQSIFVVYFARVAHLRPTLIGAILAVGGLGGVIGAALAGPLRRRLGSAQALLLTKSLGGAGALLIPLTTSPSRAPFAAVGGAVLGAGIVAGNILSSAFIQGYTTPEKLARVAATSGVVNYGTMPLGALLGGALASTAGLPVAMWFSTALVPLAAVILIVSPIRRMRDLPESSRLRCE